MKCIFTADMHLRANRPRCRLDSDWMQTQRNQLYQLADEANKRKCPIIIGGDLFNSAIVPEIVSSMFLEFTTHVKHGVYFIIGNHDLYGHSMEHLEESTISIPYHIAENMESPYLRSMKELDVAYTHFGQDIQHPDSDCLFIHQLVFESEKDMPPNVKAITAQELLDALPNYKWIFTGDMHKSFIYKSKDGRYLVNAGHFNRQKVNEMEQPVVYYIDTEKEVMEKIAIEDNIALVTDSYIKAEEDREDRISAFVEMAKSMDNFTLSIEDNIERAISENKATLDEATIAMIHTLVQKAKEEVKED